MPMFMNYMTSFNVWLTAKYMNEALNHAYKTQKRDYFTGAFRFGNPFFFLGGFIILLYAWINESASIISNCKMSGNCWCIYISSPIILYMEYARVLP